MESKRITVSDNDIIVIDDREYVVVERLAKYKNKKVYTIELPEKLKTEKELWG